MNEELKKLIEALNSYGNTTELVAAIKEHSKAVYQPMFNDGHGVATAAASTERAKFEKRATDAEAGRQTAEQELAKYKKEQPQIAQIDAQYKDQLAAKDREIADLKAGHLEEKKSALTGGAITKLRAILNQWVDADKVESLVSTKAVRDRLSLDENLALRVLQKGQQIPFAGNEEEQLKAFAEELKSGVEAKWLLSGVQAGSGRESATGGVGGAEKGKALYDKIREKARAAHPEKAPQDATKALFERTGALP